MTAQLSLFDETLASSQLIDGHLGIRGLTYFTDFLNRADQSRILQLVDQQPWQSDLRRRVQHYGYKYDYKARTIDQNMYVGALPSFGIEVAKRLVQAGLFDDEPDQMIVNEYVPGQGISAHVDCEPCFRDTIATVSLGSQCEMDFISLESGEVRSVNLQPGSALVLRSAARYDWMHRIRARLKDRGVLRMRRVSLTFRNVILDA